MSHFSKVVHYNTISVWIHLVVVKLCCISLIVSDVVKYINEKLRRPPHAPLYLYVDNEVIASENSSLARLYQEFRDNDYFLYVAYHEESIRSTDKNAK